VVVPLRLGSGTRLKIVEAWAMAKPIVSTTLGAEGIDGVPGRDILIADEPDAFAKATVRILDDPAFAKALGEAGRRLAEERYSWRAAGRALEGFMSSLLAGPRKVSAGG
jgi:glycosyltransferase involved in cell wall biosynthesis